MLWRIVIFYLHDFTLKNDHFKFKEWKVIIVDVYLKSWSYMMLKSKGPLLCQNWPDKDHCLWWPWMPDTGQNLPYLKLVMSVCEWKILEWDIKQQTSKTYCLLCLHGCYKELFTEFHQAVHWYMWRERGSSVKLFLVLIVWHDFVCRWNSAVPRKWPGRSTCTEVILLSVTLTITISIWLLW